MSKLTVFLVMIGVSYAISDPVPDAGTWIGAGDQNLFSQAFAPGNAALDMLQNMRNGAWPNNIQIPQVPRFRINFPKIPLLSPEDIKNNFEKQGKKGNFQGVASFVSSESINGKQKVKGETIFADGDEVKTFKIGNDDDE